MSGEGGGPGGSGSLAEWPARAGAAEAAIRTRADLVRFLEARPEAATPALVRRLKRRVESLHRTDARAARELAECVAVVAGRCGDLESQALADRARALAALASGSWKEALARYEAAERLYRLSGNEVELGKVLRSALDAQMHLGRYEEALAAGREAEAIFRRRGLPLLAAQVQANAGNVFHRMDRQAESLRAYDGALPAFREAGDVEAVAMVEFNRACVLSALDELGEAGRGYRRALIYYRSTGYRLRETQCLYELANLAYLRGRYGESLRLFDRVESAGEELGDRRRTALCELDRAELLLALNAWDEVSERAARAQTELEALGMSYEAAKAVMFRALAELRLERFAAAGRLLEDAGRRFDREGNAVHLGLIDLYRAELARRLGDPAGSLALARGAARLFSAQGLPTKEAYARVVAARALADLGRRAAAVRQCALALSRLRRSPSAWVAYQARHLVGRLAREPATRRRNLEEALRLVERLRAHVLPDELHASFQRDKVSLYEDCVAAVLEGAGGAGAVAGLEEVFEILELGRARALGDSLARLVPDVVRGEIPPPGRVRAAVRRELEELNGCYRRMNRAELEGRGSDARALRDQIDRLEARLPGSFRTVQLEGPGRPELRRGAEAGVGAVRRLLEPDEALVEFFSLGEDIHALVVLPDGIRRVPLLARRDDVRRTLHRLRFQVERAHLGLDAADAHGEALGAATLHYLDELSEMLWRPLAPALDGARKLVLVPVGPLFYVPFQALRERDRFLVERLEISRAPSARAFLFAHRLRARRRNPPLVLGLERPELPSVAAEVEAVAARLPGSRVLKGARARRSALRRFGDGAPVVHIASHARFRADNPLLSAIELADGWLTFYDLFDLRLGADLVVLSGCQTGRDEVLDGDELMGLSRGFLCAGAAALLVTLWPVRDAAVAAFMGRFYAALEGGGGPRAALRRATCELLEEGSPPHEWGAFYLSGRPR